MQLFAEEVSMAGQRLEDFLRAGNLRRVQLQVGLEAFDYAMGGSQEIPFGPTNTNAIKRNQKTLGRAEVWLFSQTQFCP